LVNQHAVGLIHDGKTQSAEQHLPVNTVTGAKPVELPSQPAATPAQHHAVPEVVEGHLFAGTVGDIAAVGLAALIRVCDVLGDGSHGEPEHVEDWRHQLGVALD
jgi:hypothetical protein